MSKIVGEEIPSYVAQQINKRQAAQGKTKNRTDQDMLYLNARTSWIKLASGVYDKSDTSSAKNNILYNGLSEYMKPDGALGQSHSFSAKYGDGTSEYGYQPMPGIVSADIRCMNRGSIKKATVQIKAFTPEQFNTLDRLYLRIGYTMFLEWGHSIYLNNEGGLEKMGYTLIEADQGFFACTDYYQMLGKIEYYRQGKFGNYDGLICKVVNFSWHIAQDGSYDITLELISVGDVVESLKTNISPNKELANGIDRTLGASTNTENQEENEISPSSNIISAYLYFQHLLNQNLNNYSAKKVYAHIPSQKEHLKIGHFVKLSEGGLPPYFKKNSNPKDVASEGYWYLRSSADEWVKKNLDGYTNAGDDKTRNLLKQKQYSIVWDGITYSVYYNTNSDVSEINFGNIEQGTRNVLFINYENRGANENDSSTGYYMRFGHLLNFLDNYVVPKSQSNGTTKIVKISYGISEMYRHPYQYSADPRVCVVAIPSKEPVRTKLFLVGVDEKDFEDDVKWKIKGYTANSMNIYVSHTQILKSLESNLDDKGNLSLFNFLKDICNALNVALCGVNNLEPVIDETSNTLHIIDSSLHKNKSEGAYGLELYGYNNDYKSSNFVRSFNLKTEITPEFATMASIGATAAGYVKGTENTMFSRWNTGLTDRFQDEWHAPTSDNSKDARTDVLDLYKSRIWEGMYSAFGARKVNDKLQFNPNIIDRNVSIMTEFFKYVQSEQRNHNSKYSSTQNGFIPISLGVTMDGISGIKIYNSLHVSTGFLPKNYPDNLIFIIKGVNHKLSNNDWETTLETVVVSKIETEK